MDELKQLEEELSKLEDKMDEDYLQFDQIKDRLTQQQGKALSLRYRIHNLQRELYIHDWKQSEIQNQHS